MAAPLVSIITPTFNRHHFLPFAARFVLDQSVSDLEWLVLDDSPTPSEFMQGLSDPRIIYEHTSQKLTTGGKRNHLIGKARAPIIAQFDDDDFYGPNYLATMLAAMDQNGSDIVKFFGFFLYHKLYKTLGFWDLNIKLGPHWIWSGAAPSMVMLTEQNNHVLKDNHLGFGFSYVFRRKVWEHGQFPDMNWNQDGAFMLNAVQRFKLTGLYDVGCTCLHVLHGSNVSRVFPQYLIPNFLLPSLFPQAEALLAV
jgi:glycosyltransferase involved in cell wall biosynthesis